ncbi:MAG: glycoside hydrolase family 13 protein [Aeromicrobium sp.]
MTISTPWWRDAVIYQVYPRSWADSDGDGIGDLPGITSRLDHLVDLGVDAVWLSPFYVSPQNDGGYDVADPRDVDPLFGTLDDFDALLERAHALGLRVIVDVVPNHSSSEHAWFRAALAAGPRSRERARYLFRDGTGMGGEQPPNNWLSSFGGPAWTRVTEADGSPGQWYLHLFDTTQPDFDWECTEVREEMESVLRFWLDRGVDGFRIDVAHGLVKAPGLPDTDLTLDPLRDPTGLQPMWDQPGVHEIYRAWRRLTDSYSVPGQDCDRILCAEAWVEPAAALAHYVRPDELHHCFNFHYLMTAWNATALRHSIAESLQQANAVGAPQTWVLSNHDVVRHASRFGSGEVGLRRARAATALMLALPGSAYLYQGEELGLPEATQLPDDARRDPIWERSGHQVVGRDGCRVPVPWQADKPGFGFGPTRRTWLPQPPVYGDLAPERQRGVPGSTLELYRLLLRLRHDHRLGRGDLEWAATDPEILRFTNRGVTVVANFGPSPVMLSPEAVVLVSSAADDDVSTLLPDTTVWLAT